MFHFYTSWKHSDTKSFLMHSEDIEKKHWPQMVWRFYFMICKKLWFIWNHDCCVYFLKFFICSSSSSPYPQIFLFAFFTREMIDSTNKENISRICIVLLMLFFQTLLQNSVDGKLLITLPKGSLRHVKTKSIN